jgi:hypothetical protein
VPSALNVIPCWSGFHFRRSNRFFATYSNVFRSEDSSEITSFSMLHRTKAGSPSPGRSVRVSHGPIVSILNRYLSGLILPRPHSQKSSFTLIQPRLTPKHQENAEHQSRDAEHCEVAIMTLSLRTAAIDLNSFNLILAGQNSSPDETSIASLDVRDLVQAENCLRKIENRQRNQRAQFTTNSSRMNCCLSCFPHGPNHRCDARATAYADRAITRRRNGEGQRQERQERQVSST